MIVLAALVSGYLLDLAFGDPRWMPAPVVYMGKLISALEHPLRRLFPATKAGEHAAGAVLAVVLCSVSFLVPFALLALAALVHPVLVYVLQTLWCYQVLATRSLRDESMKVHAALARADLPTARTAVSMIVGRDTDVLDETGVAKAAVETVAENTADGMVAPMLYFALGGAPLALMYKAINTMDSMVAYKNDAYRYYGTVPAHLDDVANWLPARLAALLMICASALCRMDASGAWRIWRRDRFNHASPNSAQTESVCAGALDIELAGDAVYFGKKVEKKTIGDAARAVEIEDIRRANLLLYATSALSLVLCGAIRLAMIGAFHV